MARKTPVPQANREVILECTHQNCPSCGQKMWNDYDNERTIRTLEGVVRLTLKVRRCPNMECERYHQVYRPESEGKWALPVHEFGLDLIADCGTRLISRTSQCPPNPCCLKRTGNYHCTKECEQSLRPL